MVTNGYGHSDDKNLKLAESHEGIDGVNSFFVCSYEFRKVKSYFNNFLVGVVKNGLGHLSHGTLKSAVSQK